MQVTELLRYCKFSVKNFDDIASVRMWLLETFKRKEEFFKL